MLGFIGASIIGTFVPLIASITPQLVDFAYIVLGMAMAALGINVNFKAIASKGKKPRDFGCQGCALASMCNQEKCLEELDGLKIETKGVEA